MDIYRLPGIMANVGAGSDALAASAAQNTGVEGFSDRGTEHSTGSTAQARSRKGYATDSQNVGWSYPGTKTKQFGRRRF